MNTINSSISERLLYNNEDVFCVTPMLISNCVTYPKKNKSDGDKCFNSNHIINGEHRLFILLFLLFNAMLVHGYYPSELLKSTIISLPKDKTASLSSNINYRGISLFNSICKLYDYAIIDICGDSLDTCDMQYGFKKKHSTTLCTVVLKELVHRHRYRESNSDVYCCLLDASKAFDIIHYGELFTLLLLFTKMHVKIHRLIIDSYVSQSNRISWDNVYTNYFQLLNGVKQGGVLSAKLFTLYIDSLFTVLKQSGYGCHINNTYIK